jgi:predicted RNA-binding Zn-ribbon protein involved in translation (DUF1610 family)
MQAYSDVSREDDTYALPNIEVWQADVMTCDHCDVTFPDTAENPLLCPECGKRTRAACTARNAWFWHSCFPGCLPDSEPFGPFETAAEALADAREGVE